jgi:hypothetical protein
MASLGRQFMRVFFEFFSPKANKVIPLLIEKREMEEAEVRLAAAAEKPLGYADIVPEDASEELVKNAQDLDRLDSAFPMRGPLGEESTEEWVMRETKPLRNPDWRCGKCTYGVSLDGEDDVRTRWCADCDEERILWMQDDLEWMHDYEVARVYRSQWDMGTVPLGGWAHL